VARVLPHLLLVFAALLFSTGGAAIKGTALGPFEVAGYRSGIAALTLLVLVREARATWDRRMLFASVSFAATMLLFVLANRETTAASTVFLQATAPVWIIILGPRLLGERATARDLWLLLVMGVGFALLLAAPSVAQQTAPRPLLGNVLGALAGLTWGATLVGLRRLGRAGQSGVPAVVLGNALAFALAFPFALGEGGLATAERGDVLALLWLGVFQVGVAYVCLGTALKHVTALEAGLLLLLEPVLSPVWAWLAHGERPGGWTLAGGAVVMLGLTLRAFGRPAPPPEPG
jgi:drug/metabolite transporter (DMT)-like permease